MRTFNESDLTMPRRKPRSLAISISYRIVRVARAIFGVKAVLRFFLNLSWLAWRHAFELSEHMFGSEFQTRVRGISDDLLREFIPRGGTVLDAGCGPGRWSRVAARHAGMVIGVDSSRAMIERARSDTAEANIEYVIGDVRDVIGDRRVDVALLIHVLEHIDDVDAFLRLIAVAAPVLIIEVPNFEADLLNPVRHSLRSRYYTDADHVREYTASILREQLLRNDLHIVRLEQTRGSIVAVARYRDEKSAGKLR